MLPKTYYERRGISCQGKYERKTRPGKGKYLTLQLIWMAGHSFQPLTDYASARRAASHHEVSPLVDSIHSRYLEIGCRILARMGFVN